MFNIKNAMLICNIIRNIDIYSELRLWFSVALTESIRPTGLFSENDLTDINVETNVKFHVKTNFQISFHVKFEI